MTLEFSVLDPHRVSLGQLWRSGRSRVSSYRHTLSTRTFHRLVISHSILSSDMLNIWLFLCFHHTECAWPSLPLMRLGWTRIVCCAYKRLDWLPSWGFIPLTAVCMKKLLHAFGEHKFWLQHQICEQAKTCLISQVSRVHNLASRFSQYSTNRTAAWAGSISDFKFGHLQRLN